MQLIGYQEILPEADFASFAELAAKLTPEEIRSSGLRGQMGWLPQRGQDELENHGITPEIAEQVLRGEVTEEMEIYGLRMDIVAAWITIARSQQKRFEGTLAKYSRKLLGMPPMTRPVFENTDRQSDRTE